MDCALLGLMSRRSGAWARREMELGWVCQAAQFAAVGLYDEMEGTRWTEPTG